LALTNNIYNLNAGNVGIGTDVPEGKLSVHDGRLVLRNSGPAVANPSIFPQIRFKHPRTATPPALDDDWASIGIARSNDTGPAGLALSGQSDVNGASGTANVHLFVADNGNVSIGHTSPQAKLDVKPRITAIFAEIDGAGDFPCTKDWLCSQTLN
jgi:hypothetical protein